MVYVYVKDPSSIPDNARTYGPSLLKHLRGYTGWNQAWTTLTICKDDDGHIQYLPNASPPPGLRPAECPGDHSLYQITQLRTLQLFKQRVSQVQFGATTCVLKIATFAHELPSLKQEVKVFHFLASRGSTLVPKFLGYACEQDRIVGFLSEMVVGRFPSTDDADVCLKGLHQLHSEGVIHGDINKYNIIITADGLKFIDLENAIICSLRRDDDPERLTELKDKEIENLKPALDEKSGLGQPWN